MSKSISKLKRFFWLISGSEISILEQCATDHNRHMNIGLAIFTTSLIAFFTGSLAGFKLGSQDLVSSLMFGTIWCMLVFTIDRNMVGTLNKNPNEKRGKLFVAIMYRAILSMLIAFFIAIPLELWLFKGEIAKQMKKDNDANVLNQKSFEEKKYDIDGLNQEVQVYSNEIETLNNLLNNDEPPAGYENYASNKVNMQTAKSEYESKLRTYNHNVRLRKEYWGKAPAYYDSTQNKEIKIKDSYYYRKWLELWNRTKATGSDTKSLIQSKKRYDDLAKEVFSIKNRYFSEITGKKQRYDSLQIEKNAKLESNLDSVSVNTTEHEKFVFSQKGFIIEWRALNNVTGFWVVFFIWFIRGLFFIIEMLPTFTKVFTPLGPYDIKLFYQTKEVESRCIHEKEKVEEFRKKELELGINNMIMIEQQKLDHELKLQDKILKNLSRKQYNIASHILKEWEFQQRDKVSIDLQEFLDDYS